MENPVVLCRALLSSGQFLCEGKGYLIRMPSLSVTDGS